MSRVVQPLLIPCPPCAARVEHARHPEWSAMFAALDLGHDQMAHRVYWALIQRGITVDALRGMTDGQLLALPNFGVGMLQRVRGIVPAPARLERTGGDVGA